MNESYLRELVESLRLTGGKFAAGLTDAEVNAVEAAYGFRFPPDLRAFLQYALPVSKEWVNWRDARAEKRLRKWLDWPAEGICFDVEHNVFWHAEWGEKPTDINEAQSVARRHIAQAPTLIPIYSHRYLPSEPLAAGNPVFSVYQTDIIYYGYDLASYFAHEFIELMPIPEGAAKSPRPVRFWDYFVDGAADEQRQA